MKQKKYRFSTFEAMKKADVERSRFYHWLRDGFLPEGELVKWGRGYKTVFSLYDVYSISLFKECVDFSLSRKVAKRYMNYVDWDLIIKKMSRFMIIEYKKVSVKSKDGKCKIQSIEEPKFYDNLLEMVYPKHLVEQFAKAIAYSEVLEKQDDQRDIKETICPKTLEEQEEKEIVYQVVHHKGSEDHDESRQTYMGFFIDLLKIMEDVDKRG